MKKAGTVVVISFCLSFSACGGRKESSTTTAPSSVPSACPTPPSGSITINGGETLRMTFKLPATADTDVLVTAFGWEGGSSSYTYRLLNGSALLGTVQGGPTPLWKSANSQFIPGTVVDFSTIVNGTIDGKAEFVFDSGSARFDLSRAIVSVGRSISSDGFRVIASATTVFTLISTSCR